ncbi:NAD(P)/FAD-dependent oxidoreductase [Dietzia sp. ANT_WB102]|uniref:NAD(P)/FAD-dependent oxidoreductase n=1 Tax=Dietzia sp. ANT_WB102 TaxID=2597345 RepID=UPI0011EBA4D2|nr:NAD(P)/FAD-dependent oxidoreductase [Dietzia sp. ANT_WB102]KAA0918017.1 NAD(P)/FAD-dependent oxidoreductase [Dietzia sp. ANT_WB102]
MTQHPAAEPSHPESPTVLDHDVVIVGAGFAGLYAAKKLGRAGVDVLLLDQNPYHQFQPLLYQAATSQIAISTVARPLREILRGERDHVKIRTARVADVDATTKTVTTEDGLVYRGKILVIAVGTEPNFFNTPGARELAYPLYSVDDATSLSSAMLGALERAAATQEAGGERRPFGVAVVGAGPTGVETAGAIAENINAVVSEQYSPDFAASINVHLIDMGDTVLPPFSKQSQKYTRRSLQDLGIIIHLGAAVASVTENGVTLADDTTIPAGIVVWTAGLKASGLLGAAGLPTGRGGRVDVRPDLTVPDFPGVYVLGDAANIVDAKGRTLPQLGSVAKQSGQWAADNIQAELAGQAPTPFGYRDLGFMAMIGRGHAVAEVTPRRFQINGLLAFLSWLAVHLVLLSGMQQRIAALVSWFRDYLTTSRPQVVVYQPQQYARTRQRGTTADRSTTGVNND